MTVQQTAASSEDSRGRGPALAEKAAAQRGSRGLWVGGGGFAGDGMMKAMLGRAVWGGGAPRRVVASVLQRGYRTAARPSQNRRTPRDDTGYDTWGAGSQLTRKQMDEVDYFRACAARNRSRRAMRRSGKRLQLSDKDIRHWTKILFGTAAEAGVNFAKYDDVAVELKGKTEGVEPLVSFQDIPSLPPFLSLNIERCKYVTPTPVQKHAVPLGLQDLDVMCCSQTGSGKTCAFLLPAVSKLSTSSEVDGFDEDEGVAAPRVVVMAPTRELAKQTQQEVQKLCFQGPLRSVEICTSHFALQLQAWILCLP